MNTRISKLLVLVLALVMVVSVFAGCVNTDPTDAPTDEPTTGSTDNTAGTGDEGIFPLKEKKTYKIYVKGSIDWEKNLAKNAWYQELVEKTNIEIEFAPLGTDAAGALNNLFLSGTYGHAYIGNVLSAAQVVEAAAGGYLLPLEGYLTEEVMPGYSAAIAALPAAVDGMRTTDGHIYTLARINSQTTNQYVESPLVINKEWMKKAGLTDVSTIEKFEQYLKYVKDEDVNGNGDKDDEIPFLVTGSSSLDAQATLQGILNWWGIPTKDGASEYYAVINNGTVQLAPETNAYRAAITKVAEWFKAGYLWEQFYTGKTAAMKSLITESEVPVVGCYNSNAFAPFDTAIAGDTAPGNGKDDNGIYAYVGVPVPKGYTPRLFINPGVNGTRDCYAILDTCSEEDAKNILAWMDLAMFTIEGSLFSTGNHPDQSEYTEGWYDKYDRDENGKLTKVELTPEQITSDNDLEAAIPEGITLYKVIGSFTYCYPPSYYDPETGMGARNIRFQLMDDAGVYEQYYNTEIWARPYATPDQTTELSFLWTDVKAVITKYETAFIKGEMEITDANWNAYMKELYKAGSKTMVGVLQDVYDATKG